MYACFSLWIVGMSCLALRTQGFVDRPTEKNQVDSEWTSTTTVGICCVKISQEKPQWHKTLHTKYVEAIWSVLHMLSHNISTEKGFWDIHGITLVQTIFFYQTHTHMHTPFWTLSKGNTHEKGWYEASDFEYAWYHQMTYAYVILGHSISKRVIQGASLWPHCL